MPTDLNQLLKNMVKKGASDLHIGANAKPHFRIDERMIEAGSASMNERSSKDFVYSILTKEKKERVEREKGLVFVFRREGPGRFRGNLFW